jgi:hypothetical protein
LHAFDSPVMGIACEGFHSQSSDTRHQFEKLQVDSLVGSSGEVADSSLHNFPFRVRVEKKSLPPAGATCIGTHTEIWEIQICRDSGIPS